MKLFTFVTLGGLSLAHAARLDARQQDGCDHNDCYRAVWGNDTNLVPILGVVFCERHLTTTELIFPLYEKKDFSPVAHSTDRRQCYEHICRGHTDYNDCVLYHRSTSIVGY
jgi:hypothetical protein